MKQNATAHIARNKSRMKHYSMQCSKLGELTTSLDKVYLNNGDNFEIELFNGYTTEVLAKIWINDELISNSGLILKPGQRYFLERFINSNNKFKFDTYEVENNNAVKEAIKNNGKVRVEFYQRFVNINQNNSIINWDLWKQTTNPNPNYPYLTYTNTNMLIGDTVMYNASINCSVAGSIETGRIEKGEASEQTFESVSMEFSQFASNIVEMQILPASHQPVEVNQIRNYCSGCGSRIRKQSWKFCPSCGEQLD